MAISRCPKESCGNGTFEVKELKVQKSAFRLMAIQCASCGTVVSVTEYDNIGALISKIADKLGIKI